MRFVVHGKTHVTRGGPTTVHRDITTPAFLDDIATVPQRGAPEVTTGC